MSTLPPGPRSPALVQTFRFGADPLAFLDDCRRRYGDTFTVRFSGMGTWVLFSSPREIKELFTGDPEVLHAGEANHSMFGIVAGSRSTLVLEGQEHLRRKRVLLPPFHGDRMHVYGDLTREITEEMVRGWAAGKAFKLLPDLQRITLLVIIRSLFGLDRSAQGDHLTQQLVRMMDVIGHSALYLVPALQWDLGRYSPWGRVVHEIREADRALYAEVARRKAEPESEGRGDILSLLLRAKDEEGRPLSDVELRDELMSLLIGGHETTAKSLAWALERILSGPEVEARIRAELDAVLAGRPPDAAALSRLEYLDAVIKEVLRIRPITSVAGTRRLAAPWSIAGYQLPAGVTVAAANALLHRRPELYPEPEVFRPERFLGKRPDPYEWIPFGGGVRRCPGTAFAPYQMKMVVATVLSRCRLRLPAPNLPGAFHGLLLAPKGGLEVALVERLGAAA